MDKIQQVFAVVSFFVLDSRISDILKKVWISDEGVLE